MKIGGLVFWLALCFGAARLNAVFPPGDWYEGLVKPPWTPPEWTFAPIWITIYLLMSVSAWLVWQKRRVRGAYLALGLFVLQLLFNAAWSWIFFGMHLMLAALVEMAVLWFLVFATAMSFRPYSPAAAALLVPYLAWLVAAFSLNLGLWWLNA